MRGLLQVYFLSSFIPATVSLLCLPSLSMVCPKVAAVNDISYCIFSHYDLFSINLFLVIEKFEK